MNDPTDGEFEILKNPHYAPAAPNGWHTVNGVTYETTRGNYGIAHENWDAGADYLDNYRPEGRPRGGDGSRLKFNFPYYNISNLDTAKEIAPAAITQLFYTNNIFHDLLDSLGFTEEAGNFEEVNSSGLGRGGDAVQLNAQDGAGYNNANFATPTDGNRPRMVSSLFYFN